MTAEPTCPVELTAKYERLACWTANRFRRKVRDADFEDALQVARLSVWRAANAWDRNRGVKFISYATRAALNDLNRWWQINRRGGLTHLGDSRMFEQGGTIPDVPKMLSVVWNGGRKCEELIDEVPGREPGLQWEPDYWQRVLAPLSRSQQRVILGLYVRGLSTNEIARELRVTKSRVGQYRTQAIALLRSELPSFAECC